MSVQSSASASSSHARHLRLSLKRGLAKQTMSAARKQQADNAAVFAALHRMAPNRRSMERTVLRLRKLSGIVSAGIAQGGVVLIMRNACNMMTRKDGMDLFTEDALIYTRVRALPEKFRVGILINRVSFSRHALERFIERGSCDLGPRVLAAADAETPALLKHAVQDNLIEHDGDEYLQGREQGVWAGSLDLTKPEPEWRIAREDTCIPAFSARTFLGPDEMKPCVWLRWQNDPRLSVKARSRVRTATTRRFCRSRAMAPLAGS